MYCTGTDVRYFLVFALRTDSGFPLNPSMGRWKSLRRFYREPTIFILSKNKKQELNIFFSSKIFDCFVLLVSVFALRPGQQFFSHFGTASWV